MRPFIVITVVCFVIFFPAWLFDTAWVLLISWLPAIIIGAYLDSEIDQGNINH